MQIRDLGPPTYTFSGVLTAADIKRYIALPFHVPAHTTCVKIEFRFDPLSVRGIENKIAVSLYEPDGAFRGTSYGGQNRKTIRMGPDDTDPGFFAGPLPSGQWKAELDTFMIAPGSPVSYKMYITLSDGPEPGERNASKFPVQAIGRKGGWYRGDLHLHSCHSDGDLSIADLLRLARQHSLDFVALTDHNNVTQLHDAGIDDVNDLVIIPGMELSTYYGHALSLGVTKWIDWRVGQNGWTMQDAADEIHADGGILVAAHPGEVGDPACPGCRWLFADLMPGGLDAVEVWNGPWDHVRAKNEISLQNWYRRVSAGHRLAATAGSDAHCAVRYGAHPGFNLIRADELSAKGLLDGLRRRHVMLTSGPRLWIEAPLPDGGVAIMGDTIPAAGKVVSVVVRWADAPSGAEVRLISDGYMQLEWPANGEGKLAAEAFAMYSIGVELRSAGGSLLALANPLYSEANPAL